MYGGWVDGVRWMGLSHNLEFERNARARGRDSHRNRRNIRHSRQSETTPSRNGGKASAYVCLLHSISIKIRNQRSQNLWLHSPQMMIVSMIQCPYCMSHSLKMVRSKNYSKLCHVVLSVVQRRHDCESHAIDLDAYLLTPACCLI